MSHANLSPSKAHRWMNCPGSIREEAKFPDDRSGPAAIDGTHTHTLLEQCIKNNGDPMKMIGITLSDHDGTFVIDEPRAERVQYALNEIQKIIQEMDGEVTVISEQRVDAGSLINRDDLAGTADVTLIGDNEIVVIDYKDGMTPVDVLENPQLKIYGCGVLAKYGKPSIVKVQMVIIQPKLRIRNMHPVSIDETTPEKLLTWLSNDVAQSAEATDDPDALLKAGSHCKWCKASPCSAMKEESLKGLGIMSEHIDIANQAAQKDPAQLTNDEIRDIMESVPLIKSFIESVEKEAMTRLKAGHSISGLKVIHGRGQRSWNIDDEEIAGKLKGMGIPKDVIYSAKLITPAALEKAVWMKKVKGEEVKKQLSDRQIKTIHENYIAKKAGGLKVALEAEPGEPVVFNVAPMFGNVQTQTTEELPSWLLGL